MVKLSRAYNGITSVGVRALLDDNEETVTRSFASRVTS